MKYDPDVIDRWQRRKRFAAVVTAIGLVIQSVGLRFDDYNGDLPLKLIFLVVSFVSGLVACFYWYRLKRLPVNA